MTNGKLNVSSILETARYNLTKTAKRINLNDDILNIISEPKEKIEVNINPTLPNGKIIQIKTFVVRHNDALGPAKGGIRMAETVTLDDIVGLSMEMTWKTSLIGVPFGGGKSGICFNSGKFSPEDKEAVIRSFTRGLNRHIGPEIYIPAPDMGTNETDMGHIRDCIAYSTGTSITNGCFVTGKPVILGGIVGRKEATGKGVVFTILAAAEKIGMDIEKTRVAVHGFGNVASAASEMINKFNAKVIAVADESGAIKNENGLDIADLAGYAKKVGTIKGFTGGKEVSDDQFFKTDCDILIPAATQSQITTKNANHIKAKIIAEGANSPTTPKADEILNKRGIFVIPDILCNAGGVFVSYLEYTQETQREQMTLEQVEDRLNKRMQDKFAEVYNYSIENKISMRQAAMNLAVSRVVEGIYARGMLP